MSGQAAERLLKQPGMVISGQSLLRLAKSIQTTVTKAPEILDVDDFAFADLIERLKAQELA